MSYNMSNSSTSSGSSGSTDFGDFIDLHKKIINNYHFIYKLGYGAYAQVWLTYNHKKDKFYALKVQDPDNYDEAKDEIKILSKVKKLPYCVQLIEHFVFMVEKKKYCVMVFPVYGENIHNLLKKDCFKNGMPEDIVMKFKDQTLRNLYMLHNKYNLIHCDLKPDNFLLSRPTPKVLEIMNQYNKEKFMGVYKRLLEDEKLKKDELNNRQKLHNALVDSIDFEKINEMEISSGDILRMTNKSDFIMSDFGSFCDIEDKYDEDFGTRYYRSPENILITDDLDYATDIWSLGCTIYELLTNEYIFDPDKDKEYSRDHYHLSEIFQLGKFSNKEIKTFAKRKKFFKKDKSLKRLPKGNDINEKLNELSSYWNNFCRSCFVVSYKKRLSASKLLDLDKDQTTPSYSEQ